MISYLFYSKLVWMLPACYIPKYYLQSCVYLYLVPILPHRIGNLLAYIAALFVAKFCNLSTVRGEDARSGDPVLLVVGSNPP